MKCRWSVAPALTVVLCTVAMTMSSAHAAEHPGVPVRVWAQRVCTAMRPAANRAAGVINETSAISSDTPRTTDEVIQRIHRLDRMLGAVADAMGAMRDGMANAGVPKIAHGRQRVRVIVRDIERVVDGIAIVRHAFARFVDEADTDPVGAAAQVRDAFDHHLSTKTFRDATNDWPPSLRRAMVKSPTCQGAVSALKDATTAL